MAALSTKLPWELASPKWAATLNPVIAIPMLSGIQIDSIIMKAGIPNVINHLLQRMPQGWFLMDNIANSVIWRSAAFSVNFITLTASVDTTISIWVF